jgi:hypothetical protein
MRKLGVLSGFILVAIANSQLDYWEKEHAVRRQGAWKWQKGRYSVHYRLYARDGM